jgi:transcriptional regulator with XRE-family HTH domain
MPARVNPDVPGEARLLRAVGKRIRTRREAAGLTLAELGMNRRGVVYFQRQYVWKMETGRVAPSLAALAHFAKRLDCRIADLLAGL